MAAGWLLELSHCQLSLYDCYLACSSHTEKTECLTQDFMPHFFPAATLLNLLGLGTSPLYAGLHTPGLGSINGQKL